MLRMKKITEMYGMKAFTESGEFFGTVEEVIITQSRIHGWRISSARNSMLSRVIGNAKGVIVPHNLIKDIGDIIIVHDSALPLHGHEED